MMTARRLPVKARPEVLREGAAGLEMRLGGSVHTAERLFPQRAAAREFGAAQPLDWFVVPAQAEAHKRFKDAAL